MRSVFVLCRHGNTFEKGDKVVMVGAHEDLPLTTQGIEQARAVGVALGSLQITPGRIISGPLQRTTMFAERVRSDTGVTAPIEIDARLIEFDYGAWSGLSNEEIAAMSGQSALEAWQERSERPNGITFIPSGEQARSDAAALLNELIGFEGVCLIVTSNGRLREFGQLLNEASTVPSYKVKTGHSCVVVREGTQWTVLGWDLDPERLTKVLRGLS